MAKLNTKIVMLKGEQGKDGTNIKSIQKSASDGLTDTYTITLTDGSKSSFNVTNGKGIKSISKTGAIGLDDIYTITYNDETTSTFTVPNGKATELIQSQIVPTASIEKGETASNAYLEGDFLVKDGILYKVTNAIAKDDALTVGTNIAMTTVGSELSSISERLSQMSQSEYKVKEYTFQYTTTNQWAYYNIDESNAFLDGSSYLEATDSIQYPLNYSTDTNGRIDYRNGIKKIDVWSNHAGTVHAFIRYK